MKSLRDQAVAVQKRGHAGLIVALAVFWVLPQLVFWILAWNPRHAVVWMAFLFSTAIALLAVRLPPSYYGAKPFETSGRLYEALGVRLFRRWIMHGDRMNAGIRRVFPGYRVIAGVEGMLRFEAQTRVNERAHLFALCAGLPPIAYALFLGWRGFALFLAAAAAVVHVYPILLQRYTRARIHRILAR